MKHSEKVNRVVFNGSGIQTHDLPTRSSYPLACGLWPTKHFLAVPKQVATPLGTLAVAGI